MEKNINKLISGVIIVLVVYIGFLFYKGIPSKQESSTVGNNVSSTDGKQIIEITAKGGYSPKQLTAKANTETILRIKTNNTFDCSSSLVISKLGIRQNLPPTGTTEIAITPQKEGSKIAGACSMGMYTFNINFN